MKDTYLQYWIIDVILEFGGDNLAKITPRLSIGMPVYNGEKFLKDALDSIIAQTFSDFELIISDNASTDSTKNICEAYQDKDKRIRYFRNNKNLGAAWNYNQVFEPIVGEYFKWAAHDDMMAPQLFEKCIDVLDREPQVVLVYPGTILCNENGQIEGTYSDGLNLRDHKPHQRFRSFLANPGLCHAVFGVIRSNVLRQTALIGNYPRSDRNLLGELSLAGEFYEIQENLFYRRIHPQISTEENITEYQLAVWFDPSKEGEMVFPRWRRLSEYLKAIQRVRISWLEKTLCVLELTRFLFIPDRVQGLLDDLKIVFKRKLGKGRTT